MKVALAAKTRRDAKRAKVRADKAAKAAAGPQMGDVASDVSSSGARYATGLCACEIRPQ